MEFRLLKIDRIKIKKKGKTPEKNNKPNKYMGMKRERAFFLFC